MGLALNLIEQESAFRFIDRVFFRNPCLQMQPRNVPPFWCDMAINYLSIFTRCLKLATFNCIVNDPASHLEAGNVRMRKYPANLVVRFDSV